MGQGMWVMWDDSAVRLWEGALVLLLVLTVIQWRRGFSVPYLICFVVFGFYVLMAVDLLFFPMHIITDHEPYPLAWRWRTNLIPFRFRFTEGYTYLVMRELYGNIIGTIPFGFGLSFVLRRRIRHIVPLALIVGCSGEAIQLVISLLLGYPYRSIDINDAILNTLGIFIGYALFRVFAWGFLLMTYWLHPIHRGLLGYLYEVASRTEPPITPSTTQTIQESG